LTHHNTHDVELVQTIKDTDSIRSSVTDLTISDALATVGGGENQPVPAYVDGIARQTMAQPGCVLPSASSPHHLKS
jgi:hypothetical protein